jgi:hypothetical protein
VYDRGTPDSNDALSHCDLKARQALTNNSLDEAGAAALGNDRMELTGSCTRSYGSYTQFPVSNSCGPLPTAPRQHRDE